MLDSLSLKPMVDTLPFQDEKPFLRDWLIATTLGLIVGMMMSWYIPRSALDVANWIEAGLLNGIPNQGVGQVIRTLPSYVVTTTSVGAVVGVFLGIAQWMALRRLSVPWARKWLLASVAGAVVSYLLMAAFNILGILLDPANGLLKGLADSGLWIGVIMGIAQWRVLRKVTPHAVWWIAVAIGIWAAGSSLNHFFGRQIVNLISSSLAVFIRREFGMSNLGGVRFFTMGQVVMWSIGGAMGGFITGKVLVWLVRKPLDL